MRMLDGEKQNRQEFVMDLDRDDNLQRFVYSASVWSGALYYFESKIEVDVLEIKLPAMIFITRDVPKRRVLEEKNTRCWNGNFQESSHSEYITP